MTRRWHSLIRHRQGIVHAVTVLPSDGSSVWIKGAHFARGLLSPPAPSDAMLTSEGGDEIITENDFNIVTE